MKAAYIGKVFFAKGGHLFPVTPIVENFPKNFAFSRKKSLPKKPAVLATKSLQSKKKSKK